MLSALVSCKSENDKRAEVKGKANAKMKDGKIAEEQDLMDNLGFMQQLGLIPIQ